MGNTNNTEYKLKMPTKNGLKKANISVKKYHQSPKLGESLSERMTVAQQASTNCHSEVMAKEASTRSEQEAMKTPTAPKTMPAAETEVGDTVTARLASGTTR